MLAEKKIRGYIFWSFVCLFVYALLVELPKAKIPVSASNFFILLYVSIACLVILMVKTSWKTEIPRSALLFFNLLLLCHLVAFVRGMFTAKGYFDWKNILTDSSGGLSLFILLALVAGVNFLAGKRLTKLLINLLLFSFVLIPIFMNVSDESYARIVVSVMFLIFFIPYYRSKQRLIILAVAVFSSYIALTLRTNIVHIAISIIILGIYYFKTMIPSRALLVVQVALFILPIPFLIQGINGNSIFAKNEDTEVMVAGKEGEENLTADTRTGLYEEVLSDLYDSGDIWLGRGSNGKYKTEYDWGLLEELGNERPNVEVGFLKILIQTGVLGLLLYLVLLIIAVYYGNIRSNNSFTKMLATFLATHWAMLFVENSNDYGIYYYLTWLVTGICLSKDFRSLTDQQIKDWLRYSR